MENVSGEEKIGQRDSSNKIANFKRINSLGFSTFLRKKSNINSNFNSIESITEEDHSFLVILKNTLLTNFS